MKSLSRNKTKGGHGPTSKHMRKGSGGNPYARSKTGAIAVGTGDFQNGCLPMHFQEDDD